MGLIKVRPERSKRRPKVFPMSGAAEAKGSFRFDLVGNNEWVASFKGWDPRHTLLRKEGRGVREKASKFVC